MIISIVIPVYNSSSTIALLVEKLIAVLERRNLQIVLVNDGSLDDSHEVCLGLLSGYPSILTYVRLSRNFGEHNAVMAGLNYAKGDYVVIMDDDFQNPPEEVLSIIEAARAGNYDVVYTYYDRKEHSRFRNLGSLFNNWMASYLLSKPKDLYLSSFKCLSRFAVEEVTKYTGPYPYVDGLVLRCTRNIGRVKVRHQQRQDGSSGYTIKKLGRLWLNMFLNFSILPLRVSSILGFVISSVGGFYGILVVIDKILHPEVQAGWSSIVALITIFSGVQLIILGILGEYLGNMFLGYNQSPQFVVREVYKKGG
jgi:undecaprenyl-phosphate 4-deoxy-4-formamido-L-arabinose transferase